MAITVEKLVELGPYFSLVHHIKGRIRLRVSPKIKEQSGNVTLNDIESLPQKINGIKSLKINKIVGSITIEYDPTTFPPHLWDNLISGKELDEIVTILNTLSKELC